jgi:SM-20-related protein
MAEPLLEIIDSLCTPEIWKAAWEACNRKAWYFGNASTEEHGTPFWKMDLDGVAAFDAIWEAARERCEATAGGPLRVLRQYANGHTYGLGGSPHLDDERPGTFTLLYYPMPAWEFGWDGETVFYDEAGEISMAVRPKPNRAVFFDSRIPHAGRAPSRACSTLRVTVAFKLELRQGAGASAQGPATFEETRRDGAVREYEMRIAGDFVEARAAEQLSLISQSIRLPGFRPGKIPKAILQQRYGARARNEAIRKLVAEFAPKAGPERSLLSSAEVTDGAESGRLQVKIIATCLDELAEPDFHIVTLERLVPTSSDSDAASLVEIHLREQVLDYLAATYNFPISSILVERELSTLRKAAAEQLAPGEGDPHELEAQLREVAERRVRLGVVVAEIARRRQIHSEADAPDRGRLLEDRVIAWIVSQARITDRPVSMEELWELTQ